MLAPLLVVGAPGDNSLGRDGGAVYVFTLDADSGSWIQTRKILATDGAVGDRFGTAVAIEDTSVTFGLPGEEQTVEGRNRAWNGIGEARAVWPSHGYRNWHIGKRTAVVVLDKHRYRFSGSKAGTVATIWRIQCYRLQVVPFPITDQKHM